MTGAVTSSVVPMNIIPILEEEHQNLFWACWQRDPQGLAGNHPLGMSIAPHEGTEGKGRCHHSGSKQAGPPVRAMVSVSRFLLGRSALYAAPEEISLCPVLLPVLLTAFTQPNPWRSHAQAALVQQDYSAAAWETRYTERLGR